MSTAISNPVKAPTDPHLAVLAKSSLAAVAQTSEAAIEQSIAFLAGVYGSRFLPSANSTLAWAALFGDVLPCEIAKAVVGYVRDTACDDQGRAFSSFAPSGADIYRRVAVYREERLKAERQRVEKAERERERQEWEARNGR